MDAAANSLAGSPGKMPVLFVGHGNPMNAIEENRFSRSWKEIGKALPRPRAILCISAHWETAGTAVTAMPRPTTLYDFYGFPQPLYEKRYPAPGEPALARRIAKVIPTPVIHLDFSWGLDHGTWSVLCHMFPEADIPVVQLSLDFDRPPEFHYRLGASLAHLREAEVLVIASGNMVHNLRDMAWQDDAFDWALAADAEMHGLIRRGDHQALIDYPQKGVHARRAIPTSEHYLPLLYVLAMQEPADRLSFFCESVTLGSISMRSLILGAGTIGD